MPWPSTVAVVVYKKFDPDFHAQIACAAEI